MKVNCVIEKMASIVESYIELYKEDFYKYDIERIIKEQPHEFVWLIRPTGTHLMTDSVEDGKRWAELYELFKMANKRFYHVTMNKDGSGEITLSEEQCDEFAIRMSRIQEGR